MKTNVYTENGYKSREDYLTCLADDYDVDTEIVFVLASMLGPNEDFNGLINKLKYYSGNY